MANESGSVVQALDQIRTALERLSPNDCQAVIASIQELRRDLDRRLPLPDKGENLDSAKQSEGAVSIEAHLRKLSEAIEELRRDLDNRLPAPGKGKKHPQK